MTAMPPIDRRPSSAPDRPGLGARGADEAQRRIAFRYGLSAESRAAAYLIAKGYRILGRRFRTPVGEIDIVARRGGVLVFVEVKARESFDAAAEAIGPRQRDRIIAAAQAWLAAHPQDAARPMRFDAVLVVPGRLPRHLPAAFDASS
jgi:putative endonuclease